MAFTEAERVKIRAALCYPDVFRQANTRLESAMNTIEERPDTVEYVRSVLTKIFAIKESIHTITTTSAGVKKVDEIEFFESGQLNALRDEGRQYCSNLSDSFGVELHGDFFGKQGYTGDDFMGVGFQYGSGGMFPCG